MVGFAGALRSLGAEGRVRAPPDLADLLARDGAPPVPPDVTDNRVLCDLHAQGMNAVFGAPVNAYRASLGLPAVDNVRDYVSTDHPWLAADPTLAPWPEPANFNVVQTGAWILPDERPLPEELEAFLDAGAPPVDGS